MLTHTPIHTPGILDLFLNFSIWEIDNLMSCLPALTSINSPIQRFLTFWLNGSNSQPSISIRCTNNLPKQTRDSRILS